MKKLSTLLIGTVFTLIFLNAQESPPQALSFKAIITRSSGAILAKKAIALRISIVRGDAITGITVYSETYNLSTNEYGQVDVIIGRNPDPGYNFSYIDWSDDIYFLKTELDERGGTDYTTMSITQLLAVPYALFAENVRNNGSNDIDPHNEIQSLVINGQQLSITNGNSIILPDEVDDADPDPENELITEIAINGSNLEITEASVKKTVDLSNIPGLNDRQSLSEVLRAGNSAGGNAIANLADPERDQDAATKAYVDELESKVNALEEMLINASLYKLFDVEGNSYSVVLIGTQTWMAENLRTTSFNDGTFIPYVMDNTEWQNLTVPAYCWYNHGRNIGGDTYGNKYGNLYNWYAVNTGKLCPEGWHVPTDNDWKVLTTFLGGESIAGEKLKEAGYVNWASSNTAATNESGFTALPGGLRFNTGAFRDISFYGYWWTSTVFENDLAWYRGLNSSGNDVYRNYNYKNSGFSVRCLRD